MEDESDSDIYHIWSANVITWNIYKNSGELKRLAAIQTPEKSVGYVVTEETVIINKRSKPTHTRLDGKGDPLEIGQEIQLCGQMIYIYIYIYYTHTHTHTHTHTPKSIQENETHKILSQKIIPSLKLKKNNLWLEYSVVLADPRLKMKESNTINIYLDLTRELRKLKNEKVTVIPIVLLVLGTIPKGLEKRLGELEIRGRIGTIKATVLLKSTRIHKKESWISEEIWCLSDFKNS